MLPEMNYFVLVGSDRERSQSAKVAAYISDLLYLRTGTAPHVLNLSQTMLPPWDADRYDTMTQLPLLGLRTVMR